MLIQCYKQTQPYPYGEESYFSHYYIPFAHMISLSDVLQ